MSLPVSARVGTDISSWEVRMSQRQRLRLTTPDKMPHSDTDCGLLQPIITQKAEKSPGVLGMYAPSQLKGPTILPASGSATVT